MCGWTVSRAVGEQRRVGSVPGVYNIDRKQVPFQQTVFVLEDTVEICWPTLGEPLVAHREVKERQGPYL